MNARARVRREVRRGIMQHASDTVFLGEAPAVRLHGDSEYVKWQVSRELGARTLLDGWFCPCMKLACIDHCQAYDHRDKTDSVQQEERTSAKPGDQETTHAGTHYASHIE